MKFLHLADLHLGKRLNEFSLLEDQRYILGQVLALARAEAVDAVLLAGDLYDKPVPPGEAVTLLDGFLTALGEAAIPVYAVTGNHDSAERLAFGARLLDRTGVHLAARYQGPEGPFVLTDQHGPVNLYLLPYLKPAAVRHADPEAEVSTHDQAVAWAVAQWRVDERQRNVLVAHQFVVGGATCESEELSVGGLDQVSARAFAPFDYVALGHLHGPQSVTRETLRYSGSPLKYSFSEAGHTKSATLVELGEKGQVVVRAIPLTPLRDLREVRGTYAEVAAGAFREGERREDYLHAILTDEEDVPEAMGRLRGAYPNLMKLTYDNRRTRSGQEITGAEKPESKSPLELFRDFYALQNNQPMSEDQETWLRSLMETIWEGEP